MDDVIRNVTDIDSADRQALEHVLGKRLGANQQVIISVVNLEFAGTDTSPADRPAQSLEDWTHIYDGLDEQQIEAVDRIVTTRANLTRNLP